MNIGRKKLLVAGSVLLTVVVVAIVIFVLLPVSPLAEYPWQETAPEAEAEEISVETVAENLSAPWSLGFIDEDSLVFTERPGRVRMIDNGELLDAPLLELPGAPAEGGTLGLAVDPNFDTTRYIYLYYTTAADNRVSRFRLADNELIEEEVLLSGIPSSSIHNGGRIAFGPDGHLYAGTGDAGNPSLAQNKNSPAGKILRLTHNGSVPIDNPFPGSYAYSLGHRNVQGLDWDSSGNLYATEHGPQAHDEVNLIEAGANYGWPIHTGEIDLTRTKPGVTNYRNPVLESGSSTWAPSGAAFYKNKLLPEPWRDTFIFAGLRSESLWRLEPDTENFERVFEHEYGRLRDVAAGPDGSLYLLTSNRDSRGTPEENDDRILRITVR